MKRTNVLALLLLIALLGFGVVKAQEDDKAALFDSIVFVKNETEWQVRSLTSDHPLYEAGLRAGDAITLFDGRAYNPTDLDYYIRKIGEEGNITLTVERDGQTMEINVMAGALRGMDTATPDLSFINRGIEWLQPQEEVFESDTLEEVTRPQPLSPEMLQDLFERYFSFKPQIPDFLQTLTRVSAKSQQSNL